jgi:CheY-like chemotaxis protein
MGPRNPALLPGPTVRMSFPARSASLLPREHTATPGALLQRLRIVLVDDDPLLIESLQHTLEDDGHLTTVAHSGQAGIDAFAAAMQPGESFDIIVTDLGMPHVDGREVAADICALSRLMPIILVTGWGQRMIVANDIPPHVSRVLAKPPRLQELRPVLAELALVESA